MPRPPARRLAQLALASCTVIVAVLGLSGGSAYAHNTLVSSDPANGASLDTAPAQVTWDFDNSVPLETMTVTLIDATGARTELSGSVHGTAGDTQVITPLPVLLPGPVSLRWRLVGPDGHPITGRVDFTIAATSPTTTPAIVTTVPAGSATVPPTSTSLAPAVTATADVDDGSFSTPSVVRWVLRYGSYLAVMAIVGILLTGSYVWAGAGTQPLLRWVLSRSLLATAILAVLQLLVVASDISGTAPWSSFGSIDAANTTDAGMALLLRIVLALSMWVVLFQHRIVHREVYWAAVSLPGLGLLATWAFAGHSRSMRWPAVGVAADVAHHAAAAAWIAGLAIVGWIVIPTTKPDVLVPAVRNFSRAAAVSVAVLVATGLVQSVRLVGNPTNLLDVNHGRYLAAKVVVLAAMLGVANLNRRRTETRLDDAATLDRYVGALRRAVLVEFAIGLVVIGITAAMVVSPPATSQTETGAAAAADGPLYYIM